MWPPLWGRLYWSLLRAIGKAFAVHYPEDIPPELSEALYQFIIQLCKYLPCPGCRFHCLAHTGQVPPRFTRGRDVWTYFVDFHNAVNKRTHKVLVSYDEAEVMLTEELKEFGWTPDRIEEAFSQDWWTALLMTTFSLSTTPDTPKDDEKKEFQAFMHNAALVMPFGFKKLGSGQLVHTMLVDFVASSAFDLTNRDTVFEAVTNMHNTVSSEFGILPKTVKEMKELFAKNFEQKNVTELVRVNQIHEEDQKKLVALQQELSELRGSGTAALASEASGYVSASYQTATIALSCLLGVMLLLMLVAWLSYRFKWAGDWRLQWHAQQSAGKKSTVYPGAIGASEVASSGENSGSE